MGFDHERWPVTKKQVRASESAAARKPTAKNTRVESKIGDFAEDLGRLLGTAERRATEWLDQRQTVAVQLTAIRDKATALLSQLGRGSSDAPKRRKRAGGSAKRTPGRKKRIVSAESRARMAAAQRKRWAAKRSKSSSG